MKIKLCIFFRNRFPYHKIEADPVRSTVVFRTGDTVFTIEELIAQMLQKGREFAEDYIGELKYLIYRNLCKMTNVIMNDNIGQNYQGGIL